MNDDLDLVLVRSKWGCTWGVENQPFFKIFAFFLHYFYFLHKNKNFKTI
jgi:hypothetical protein